MLYSMDAENADAGHRLRSSTGKNYMMMESYLVLHREIAMLAYQYMGEPEAAKDIASECLIEWWQQQHGNEGQMQQDTSCYIEKIVAAIKSVRTCNKRRRLSEQCFIQEQMVRIPAYKAFMVEEKEVVLDLFQVLQPMEQVVIRLILIDGLELPEISSAMKKPVPAIKILRDRAAVLLRKTISQTGVCK